MKRILKSIWDWTLIVVSAAALVALLITHWSIAFPAAWFAFYLTWEIRTLIDRRRLRHVITIQAQDAEDAKRLFNKVTAALRD